MPLPGGRLVESFAGINTPESRYFLILCWCFVNFFTGLRQNLFKKNPLQDLRRRSINFLWRPFRMSSPVWSVPASIRAGNWRSSDFRSRKAPFRSVFTGFIGVENCWVSLGESMITVLKSLISMRNCIQSTRFNNRRSGPNCWLAPRLGAWFFWKSLGIPNFGIFLMLSGFRNGDPW